MNINNIREYVEKNNFPITYVDYIKNVYTVMQDLSKKEEINLPEAYLYIEEGTTLCICWNTKNYYLSVDICDSLGMLFFRNRITKGNYGLEQVDLENFSVDPIMLPYIKLFSEDSRLENSEQEIQFSLLTSF